LTEEDIENIAENNQPVFLDTKKVLGNWCKKCDFIKINHLEFERTKHTIGKLDLYNNLIITHAHKGCEFQNTIYPVEQVTIKDMSGAGDTFISGLVCEYVKTYDIVESIKFAQQCATKVVQKKGVCTV
jgi:sugar/nucleoside kinase (ribokinase family)